MEGMNWLEYIKKEIELYQNKTGKLPKNIAVTTLLASQLGQLTEVEDGIKMNWPIQICGVNVNIMPGKGKQMRME